MANAANSRIQAEVIHCARSEMAVTVEDVLARRLGLQFIDWELAMQAAAPTAELLGAELGWPIEQRKRAAQEFVARVQQQITTVRAEAAANG